MPSVDLTPGPICTIPVPPPLPPLPSGLSFVMPLPTPSIPFEAKLCCKSVQVTAGVAFPPIAFALSSPIIIAINGVIASINGYFDLIPVFCPKAQ